MIITQIASGVLRNGHYAKQPLCQSALCQMEHILCVVAYRHRHKLSLARPFSLSPFHPPILATVPRRPALQLGTELALAHTNDYYLTTKHTRIPIQTDTLMYSCVAALLVFVSSSSVLYAFVLFHSISYVH